MPKALRACKDFGLEVDPRQASYFLGRRTIRLNPRSSMPFWQQRIFHHAHQPVSARHRVLPHPAGPCRRVGCADDGVTRAPSGLRPPPPAKLKEGIHFAPPTCWGAVRRPEGASHKTRIRYALHRPLLRPRPFLARQSPHPFQPVGRRIALDDVVNRYKAVGYDFVMMSEHFINHFNCRSPTRATCVATASQPSRAELHAPITSAGELWHIVAAGLPLDFCTRRQKRIRPGNCAPCHRGGRLCGNRPPVLVALHHRGWPRPRHLPMRWKSTTTAAPSKMTWVTATTCGPAAERRPPPHRHRHRRCPFQDA